jgi:cytochrome P450 family 135
MGHAPPPPEPVRLARHALYPRRTQPHRDPRGVRAARVSRVSIASMDLPPGPRAPAVWQTVAWMTRPGAFLRRVHARFGDPATIRTYWTQEPMVLFSSPDSVRAVFRLDPAIAPAGQSWEFLRPFAGPHSILLLDGEEHIRERRRLQGPFHGERMRAFAPMIGQLARRELATWNGRVVALERMRDLTLDIILRVVFGARDEELAHVRGVIEESLATVRSLPWVLAMAVVRKDLGPRSPWGRFRLAVERFDAELYELLARRRREAHADSMLALLLEARDERGNPPSDQHVRDQLVALLVGGHDSSAASLAWAFELLARHPEVQARLREGDPAYLEAVVKEVLRARPALTIAPRLLLEPARIADRTVPAGVQVAACLWLACRRHDLWPQADEFRPERWLDGSTPNPLSWIPFGGGVRRCAGAPFAEMEMREVLRAAGDLSLRPARPQPEHARRSMLVLTPHRGGEVIAG